MVLLYALPYILLLVAVLYFAPSLQLSDAATTAVTDVTGPIASAVGAQPDAVTATTIQMVVVTIAIGFAALLLAFQLHRIAGRVIDIDGYGRPLNYIWPNLPWLPTAGLAFVLLASLVGYVLSTNITILGLGELRLQAFSTIVSTDLQAYLMSLPTQAVFVCAALFFGLTGLSGIKRAGYLQGVRTFARGFSAILILAFIYTALVASASYFVQTTMLPAFNVGAYPRLWAAGVELLLVSGMLSFACAAWFKRMTTIAYAGTNSDMERRLFQGYVG
ncbi:hypothetical protein [Pseudaestuariivita rosea]|uniref:hypothetical protein n=1 Tax=Pseudaestuariivita rosea TaxID=2763263 RepID=UPI001ABAE819|nr:hypothetical protein [Pseudaestuariivita rosea]